MKQKKLLFIIFLSVIFWIVLFLPQSDASSYTVETSKNNDATTLTQNVSGKNGTNTAIEINADSMDTAYFKYKYTGLEKREFYIVSAYVKVNTINSSSSNSQRGAIIRLSETAASSEIIQSTSSWKQVDMVGLTGANGTLNVQFMLNECSGNVLFDEIEIKKIDTDSNFKLYSYTNDKNKTGRIVFRSENVDGTSITTEEIQTWLGVLLNVREDLANLTGIVVDDGNLDIIATNYYPAVAYVMPGTRTEVQWIKNYVDLDSLHTDFLNGADTPFFITHEIGHQHTVSQANFHGEYWGTALGEMASYRLNLKLSGLKINNVYAIRQGQSIIDYSLDSYENNFLKGNFHGDGLVYLTFKAILTLNSYQENLGWESLEQTFKTLKDTTSLSSDGEKFQMFLLTWTEKAGHDVKSLFYNNSSYDETVLDDYFKIGKFDYSFNNDGKTLVINNYSRSWEEFSSNGTYELVIPSKIDGRTVTQIKSWGFARNNNLKKVTLPSSLLVLNDVAFYDCKNLEEVVIPFDSQLQTIKSWVFTATALNQIFIPKTVTTIEDNVLSDKTIKGYLNSTAQNYANDNDLDFISIDSVLIHLDDNGATKNASLNTLFIEKDQTPPAYISTDFLLNDGKENGDTVLTIPERTGYYFDGYYYTYSGTEYKIIDETGKYVCNKKGNSNFPNTISKGTVGDEITLTAKWISNQYPIVFNVNGGDALVENTKTVTYKQAYGTLPVPTRSGYSFAGWYESNDKSSNKITEDTIVTATNTHTLYAMWTDVQPPQITIDENNLYQIEVHTNKPTFLASATDNFDDTVTVQVTDDIDVNTIGTYTVTFTATDTNGNTKVETKAFHVVDTTKPVITVNDTSNVYTMEVHGQKPTFLATALDNYDGNITNIAITDNINTAVVGNYTITFTVTDSSRNTSIETRNFNVVDTTAPQITIDENNLYQIEVHTNKPTFLASASDNFDHTVTVQITDDINVNVVGDYTITFTATDANGNTKVETKAFHVVDTTKPVITVNDTSNVYTMEVYGQKPTFLATALDNYDGNIVNVSITDNINTNIVGKYTITFTVTDSSGNTSVETREFNVIDTTAPQITIDESNLYRIEVHTNKPRFKAVATDNFDNIVNVAITDDIDIDTVGTYTITFTATDSSGNTTTKTKEFSVIKGKPTYTIPTGIQAKYTDTLSAIELPKGFTFEDDLSTSVGKEGNHKFKVTYTPENTNEYNIVTGIEITIQVQYLNIDTDGDGKPDINIDTNGDGKADINIDITKDEKPNVNIDTNGDNLPDENIVEVSKVGNNTANNEDNDLYFSQEDYTASNLYSKNDIVIYSNKYLFGNTYMEKIAPKTTVDILKAWCITNGQIEVYEKDGLQKKNNTDYVGTGMIVKITKDNSSITFVTAVQGDTTGDGIVTSSDCTAIKSHILNKDLLKNAAFRASDINRNKTITGEDLATIKAKIQYLNPEDNNTALQAMREVTPTYSVNLALLSEDKLIPNGTVEVTLKLENIDTTETGINVVKGRIDYDTSIFENYTIETKNGWTKDNNATNTFLFEKEQGVTTNEIIAVMKFKVKDTITKESTEIKLQNITASSLTVENGGSGDIKVDGIKVTLSKLQSTTENKDPNSGVNNSTTNTNTSNSSTNNSTTNTNTSNSSTSNSTANVTTSNSSANNSTANVTSNSDSSISSVNTSNSNAVRSTSNTNRSTSTGNRIKTANIVDSKSTENKLPFTGLRRNILVVIVIIALITMMLFVKNKTYKDIK